MAIEKTAVITGATSGIGRELAERFAADGYSLFLTARNEAALKGLCEQFSKRYPNAEFEYTTADLGRNEDIEKLCDMLSKMKIDVLVNNAGFGMTGEFAYCDKLQLQEMLTLNMLALTHITRAVLPYMKEQKKRKDIECCIYRRIYAKSLRSGIRCDQSLCKELLRSDKRGA